MLVVALLCASTVAFADELHKELQVVPSEVVLVGRDARQQLLVTDAAGEQPVDATRLAEYRSEAPEIVEVDSSGLVRPVADGVGTIVVAVDDREARVQVDVRHAAEVLPSNFENDIQPILTANGCNSGACHGKQRGQNGFQLSLLGFDDDFDYAAITTEARGRRIFPAAPEQSLLLMKGSALAPHGGGKRLDPHGDDYLALRRWIEAGMPRRTADEPVLVGITLEPTDRVLRIGSEQQLLVTAHYSDGSTRDVTRRSAYQSNESVIAEVDAGGLIRVGQLPGEAAIMARYMDEIATCAVVVPYEQQVPPELLASLPRDHFVDDLVWKKLEQLNLAPSPPAPDHTFVRRAYLDVLGRLPTPDETRSFLEDGAPDKRARLVDHLLEQGEYADHWANKWVDLLRPNPYRVGIKAVLNYDNWIRDAFRKNKPYDQFVRELVSAQGSTWREGNVTLFRDRRSPDEVTTMVSQLFLGIRLECAKCHHHPFEVYGQDDFYSFAAYFARIGTKGTGLSPPISGGEEMFFTKKGGSVKHPLTGEVLPPRPLFGEAPPWKRSTTRARRWPPGLPRPTIHTSRG